MRRRLFTLGAAASLVVGLAVAGMWAWSYRVGFEVGFKTREAVAESWLKDDLFEYRGAVAKGRVWLVRRRGVFGMPPGMIKEYPKEVGGRRWFWGRVAVQGYVIQNASATVWERVGFHQERMSWVHVGNVDAVYEFVIPLWAVAAMLMVWPVGWVVLRRMTAKGAGFEVGCGGGKE